MTTYTRKLVRTSTYSYAIVIPKAVIDKYGWRGGQKLTVADKGRGVLELRDWKRR